MTYELLCLRRDMWKWEANEKNGCALKLLEGKNGNFCKQGFTLRQ